MEHTMLKPDVRIAQMKRPPAYLEIDELPRSTKGESLPFFLFQATSPKCMDCLRETRKQLTDALVMVLKVHGIFMWIEDPTPRITNASIAWVPAKVGGHQGWFGFDFVQFVVYKQVVLDAPQLSGLPNRDA